MDRAELLQAWKDNAGRPQWVMEHADDLAEHVDTSDPVTDPGSVYEMDQWLSRYKSTVTKQLAADEPEAEA